MLVALLSGLVGYLFAVEHALLDLEVPLLEGVEFESGLGLVLLVVASGPLIDVVLC